MGKFYQITKEYFIRKIRYLTLAFNETKYHFFKIKRKKVCFDQVGQALCKLS